MHARKKCVTAAVTFSPWQREHRFGRERSLFYFIASTHQVSSRMTMEGQGEGVWGWGNRAGNRTIVRSRTALSRSLQKFTIHDLLQSLFWQNNTN